MLRLVVIYGCETWLMAEKDNVKYVEEENSKVHGPVTERGVWKMRTSQELRKLYKTLDLIADTERRKLK
jgi:hypothetical protein